MPNNSSARREKGKKRQDKKKKTDPPPLHKEDKARVDSTSLALAGKDKASMDSSSLSLSLSGKDKASKDISLFSSLAGKDSEKIVRKRTTQGCTQG